MLQKFENKSERVKGLSFHPKRPWLLASLHNGVIQLFDYRSRVLVDKFEEHQGPVRGISFHMTQPLFVSGGDDYKIKVWNYKQRKCLFTLHGHLDYVRTVFFHHESPWIVSASDDQTIRIWNWQSRTCINILTGHNHYVMCAQFHPRDPLLVSASLDQTIRVWDLSGMKAKSTKPTASSLNGGSGFGGVRTFEDFGRAALAAGGSGAGSAAADLFGGGSGGSSGNGAGLGGDVFVKYVLEGHDRGVNWASFHPTLPLIVSGADDRQIKIWRMSDNKAWEIDSLRGHHNNVSCVMFHPRQELILSNAEDKSIRIWDIAKRQAITVFKSEHDRFWVIAAHPELNIFAAGHDNGFILFKLERERPAYAVQDNMIFYVKDKFIRLFDSNSNGSANEVSIATVRRPTGLNVSAKYLSYNPSERCLLVTFASGNVELIMLGSDVDTSGSGGGGGANGDVKSFPGQAAVFVARNRYAILDTTSDMLTLHNVRNEASKQIALSTIAGATSSKVVGIFPAGSTAQILLVTSMNVRLYDLQQGTVLAELAVPNVKYAYWSDDLGQVALVGKTSICMASKRLVQKGLIVETAPIKAGAWDERGNVFIYSTLTHLKFALVGGDCGIIKTLEQPMYVVKVKSSTSSVSSTSGAGAGANVFCLDRDGRVRMMTIDPSEYQFKLALIKRQYDQVLDMIKRGSLIGQSVISYLRRKGYPEVALMFVKEPKARFELAVECGALDLALEAAKTLNQEVYWRSLASEGLRQGNQTVTELAYQNLRSLDRLCHLYLVLGQGEKLNKLQRLAEARSDISGLFATCIATGNVQLQYDIYMAAGQPALAFLLARNYALGKDKMDAALGDKSVERIEPYTFPNRLLAPPIPCNSSSSSSDSSSSASGGSSSTSGGGSNNVNNNGGNWPLGSMSKGLFDAASAPEETEVDVDPNPNPNPIPNVNVEKEDFYDATAVTAAAGAGWGDVMNDLDIPIETVTTAAAAANPIMPDDEDTYFYPSNNSGALDIHISGFLRNSRSPFEHIALGSFETAMALLNQQFGIVNFEPLEDYFMSIYQANCRVIPAAVSTAPSLVTSVVTSFTGSIHSSDLIRPESQVEKQCSLALNLTTQGLFGEAIQVFRSILQQACLIDSDESSLKKIFAIARDYVLALGLETERKALPDPVSPRSAELAWLFTLFPHMQPGHLKLALRSAMAIHYKAGCFKSAAQLARRILELDTQDPVAIQARKIIVFAESKGPDPVSTFAKDLFPGTFNIDSHAMVVLLTNGKEDDAKISYCPYCASCSAVKQNSGYCTVCNLARYTSSNSKSAFLN